MNHDVINEWGREWAHALPVVRTIRDLAARKSHLTIAIDGPAASGKTTLAHRLASLYQAPVISMDDFFLPPHLRSASRLAEPGGNIHRERFLEEVVPHLNGDRDFSYGIYDCAVQQITGKQAIPAAPLYIVEGSYSHHPLWRDAYDLRIFIQITPEVQQNRIIQRNGDVTWLSFRDRWIPMENRYFDFYSIAADSDIIL